MTVPYYIAFVGVGRLLIWLIQIFPLFSWFIGRRKGYLREYLEELYNCDLCLGTWVYFFLAWILGVNIFDFLLQDYSMIMEVFMYFLTGVVTSFIMHLIRLGWDSKFKVLEIN